MSDIVEKVLSEGSTPIMSEEGIYKTFRFYYERCAKHLPLFYGKDFRGGPSRRIRLATSRHRFDDLHYDKIALEAELNDKLKALYGSAYSGSVYDDFPFGRFKNGKSGAEYDMRIYINAPYGKSRYDFMFLYASKCKARGIPCGAKFIEKDKESTAVDNMVIYSSHENIVANLEILEEIQKELQDFVMYCGSPIASGLNYIYYALCHCGEFNHATYNDWFNHLSCRAFCVALSQLIKEEDEFYNNLSDNEKKIIDCIANIEYSLADLQQYKMKEKGNWAILPNELQGLDLGPNGREIALRIFERFADSKPMFSRREIVDRLRGLIEIIASISNFGDTKHTDKPISLRESDYLALRENEKSHEMGLSTGESVPSKKTKSQRRLEKLKTINSRALRTETMKAGYSYAQTTGKSEQELRSMIFDKIVLDDESIIDILCDDDEKFKATMVACGFISEGFSPSRETLEEMFILKVGIDKVIEACEGEKKKEARLGHKRFHGYESSLEAVRINRGKSIMESEEFNALKTKEEKLKFLDKLSVYELEDVERYCREVRNPFNDIEEIEHILI